MTIVPSSFDGVERSPRGHFVLNLYAAVFLLLNHIRELGEFGGASLDEVFEKYPFLANYFDQVSELIPDDLSWSEACDWWMSGIQSWEADQDRHLPLRAVFRAAELGFSNRMAFMLAGLVEEDSRFGALFADLQAPLSDRRPTLELIGHVARKAATSVDDDPWVISRPLLDAGLAEVSNPQAPRSEWLLRVPPILWDAARGQKEANPAPWLGMCPADDAPDLDSLIYPTDFLERLQRIPGLLEGGETSVLVTRSRVGGEPHELMGAVAKSLGRGTVRVVASELVANEATRFLGPLSTLTHSMPVIEYDLAPGETAEPPRLQEYGGPIGLVLGLEGGISDAVAEKAVTLSLPSPDAQLRKRYWQVALNDRKADDLDAVVERFHLGGGHIRRAARAASAYAAMEDRSSICLDDVREACRSLNRQQLDTLAHHLDAHGSWADIACMETTDLKLVELEQRVRYREKLLDHLGPAFASGTNRGVRALFTGPSGTGKTLAVKILASELGMDCYRCDLAAIINKYIGETEKNLHRVLSRAEALDIILLLDEGDAVLGQRTEVKTSNDRYANLETDYLLQRLETYEGVIIVTTNLGDNIDSAFQRRMDVVVPFFPPQAEERLQILKIHLPGSHTIDSSHLERVALQCALSGGQLRNAAQLASLLALNNGQKPVAEHHLHEALRAEYRKAGAIFPLETSEFEIRKEGMETFVDALRSY